MVAIIQEAVKNFSIHQLRTTCEEVNTFSKVRTVVAYMDIEVVDGANYRVHIAYSYELLQCIAEVYLAEEESDDETLQDMSLETTNMIVGSAKTLASETSVHFDITTPHLGESETLDVDTEDTVLLVVNNSPITIAIEERA